MRWDVQPPSLADDLHLLRRLSMNAAMFNADNAVIKKPLAGMSALKFVGSRLITGGRYLSGWTFPQLSEVWRIRGRPVRITVQPAGHLLLSRFRHEYRLSDIRQGEIASVCPVAEPLTSYDGTCALSACGRYIIAGEPGAIRVRETGTGSVVWERKLERTELCEIWPLDSGAQWAFCVGPVVQDVERPIPTSFEVWDWPFGSQPRSVLDRQSMPFGCSVSDAGLIAFPGFHSKPIGIFDLQSGSLVREFPPPAGNRYAGYAHWLSDERLALAWENGVLFVARLNEPAQREFSLPTYSVYSVAATDELLALAYHDGFVLVPLDSLPDSQGAIELSPPWEDAPEPQHDITGHSFVTPQPAMHRSVEGETMDELRTELKEFERPAWIPQVRFRAGEVTSSKLGGTPWLSQAEEWPRCGVCSRPMELFLQLNSGDLPGEMSNRFQGLLQVFLCVTNGYSTGTCALGYEGFSKASMLRLCDPVGPPRYRRPPFDDAFIEGVVESWRTRVDLPALDDLAALGIELSDSQQTLVIDSSERFAAGGDKLGGWPNWPQNLDYMACPRCARRMDVIFQIDSDYTLPHTFMDGGTAWVSQCRDHSEVFALNWNS